MTAVTPLAAADRPLLRVEEAVEAILAAIAGPTATEAVATPAALGRVLAEPAAAVVSLPPWPNSAMDGYAIRAADVAAAAEARPTRLSVTGELRAGAAPSTAVEPGCAIRIATGARIPAGADAVVPVEETTPLDDAGGAGRRGREAAGPLPSAILVHVAVPVGGSIRDVGGDLRAGDRLLDAGSVVTPAAIALLAGAGVAEVSVHRRPRVAVLATGDEVRAAGEPLGEAGIPDANGPGLRSLVAAAGADVLDLGIARDDAAVVEAAMRRALEAGADALIVSGGVSVGPYDVVKGAFESIGRIGLWRVAVQPGKPFAFGTARRPDGEARRAGAPPMLLFGLPGNPVSSFVTFELFVRPALRRLAGRPALGRDLDVGVLLEPVTKSHGRRAYLRVAAERDGAGAVTRDERGRVRVRLAGGQGSHVLSALAAADALAIVPEADDALPAGAGVELWWLERSA